MLNNEIFNTDPLEVAKNLIGKVICHKVDGIWLKAMIIETEAYYADEPGSHSSKGRTNSKEALYMPAGTIYMHYSRGHDSIGFSTLGDGNGILIKSAIPYTDKLESNILTDKMLNMMHQLNPINKRKRENHLLCSGQTLFCKSLGLKVKDWNKKSLDENRFKLIDVGYIPEKLVLCRRLGIPKNRNYELLHRVFDTKYARSITKDPRSKNSLEGQDYLYV